MENKTNFEKLLKNISLNDSVFQPNLTSQLSIEVALDEIKNNFNILDLGCGCGIIGIMVMENFSNIQMHCSDIDKKSIELTKVNFTKYNLKADIRHGNLFNPWNEKKFDYIINDVSAISNIIAEISPWYGKNIPCESGDDGTELALKIINESSKFLTEKGTLQIPLLNLSNTKKIIKRAKDTFSEFKIVKSKDWFLPTEMDNYKDVLYKLKSKSLINFEEKFRKIICNTSIAICKAPKKL